MTDEAEKFCCTLHPDGGYSGVFESREEALADLIVTHSLQEGDQAWTGVIESIPPETLAASAGAYIESILEIMGEAAMELVGEVADDWPPSDLSSKIYRSMDEELRTLVVKWIKEHLPYNFHTVNDEQCHVVTAEEADTD